MFGYIRIAKPELKVKEYEMYKAVYCSLCKKLGKQYGIWARFTLNYDFTFLALLNLSLQDGCMAIERKHCVVNPLKRCNFCRNEGGWLDMPAAVAMIMLYYKVCDNITDEKGVKKLGYLLVKPLFSKARRKAAKISPEADGYVKEYISRQTSLERDNCGSLDPAADPTAAALANIFALCGRDDISKKVLNRLGYCMGRYIYIMDAACDFDEDVRKGAYNVLKTDCDDMESVRARVKPQLYFCINEAGKAFELLDIKKNRDILGNIIYLGLEDTFKKELKI